MHLRGFIKHVFQFFYLIWCKADAHAALGAPKKNGLFTVVGWHKVIIIQIVQHLFEPDKFWYSKSNTACFVYHGVQLAVFAPADVASTIFT
jgi:hypothetical protein